MRFTDHPRTVLDIRLVSCPLLRFLKKHINITSHLDLSMKKKTKKKLREYHDYRTLIFFFKKASFAQCFQPTLISVDGRPNGRNKAAISNSSAVVWTRPLSRSFFIHYSFIVLIIIIIIMII